VVVGGVDCPKLVDNTSGEEDKNGTLDGGEGGGLGDKARGAKGGGGVPLPVPRVVLVVALVEGPVPLAGGWPCRRPRLTLFNGGVCREKRSVKNESAKRTRNEMAQKPMFSLDWSSCSL